jgi:hypothetical protein
MDSNFGGIDVKRGTPDLSATTKQSYYTELRYCELNLAVYMWSCVCQICVREWSCCVEPQALVAGNLPTCEVPALEPFIWDMSVGIPRVGNIVCGLLHVVVWAASAL